MDCPVKGGSWNSLFLRLIERENQLAVVHEGSHPLFAVVLIFPPAHTEEVQEYEHAGLGKVTKGWRGQHTPLDHCKAELIPPAFLVH